MNLYGIPNCNTVKKARDWLQAHDIAYTFHDYKKQGVPSALISQLLDQFGWEVLINRKGPTWRNLPDAVRDGVTDNAAALKVMEANASVIKRPILEDAGRYLIGFVEADYARHFSK